jgi:hypothetical protein
MGYAPKALWVYLIVVALVACTARVQADGKFFGVVAAEGNGDPTIPAQRAVIAWDPPYQTLAIDTAFVGVGDRFAWLVPLPSEPEIRPATRGMFDSVAALTAPRITPASQTLPGQMLAVMLIITVIIGLLARSRSRDIVIVVLLCLLLPVVLVPAMGKSKRSVSDPFPAVEVLNRASAGVYDTATLSAEHADELIAWLNAEGFATPEGVRSVVQQYLDRGWVFAAAKVRADTTAGEHQPHPLCFRFQSESPVYPMELTGVGNSDIRLDLFVFADGSASTSLLEQRCSLPTTPGIEQPPDRDRVATRDGSDRVRIAHEGLAAVAGGLPHLTRLGGTLPPEDQRSDIMIQVAPFRLHDTQYVMPGQRVERGISVALWGGAVLLMGVLSARVFGFVSRDRALWLSGSMLLLALMAGVAGSSSVREYGGPVRTGHPSGYLVRGVEAIAEMTFIEAEDAGVHDAVGLRAIAEQQHEMAYLDGEIPPFGEGDGPLSTRLEHEPSVGWWFVWRDLAGGAHRVGPYPDAEPAPDSSGPASDPG